MSGDSTGSVFRKDYSWQERAVDALMTGISDFYNAQPGQFRHAFIVEVSPSGGKTKFSLKAAKSMIDAHLIDKVIWVVPRETIKDGFKDDAEDTGLKIDVRLDTSYNGMLRNFHGAVINYQSLDRFTARMELAAKARGMRILVVFDEIHHGRAGDFDGSEDDACSAAWAKAMGAVRQYACTVIGMTGTPVRADQERVPYLRYEKVSQMNAGAGTIGMALFVQPDFKFTYKDAIDCGVARKLIFRPQDPVVNFRYTVKDGSEREYDGKLSGVPRWLIDRAKKPLLSPDRGHINDMLKLASSENALDRKIGDDGAAILVVVGSTEDNGFNPLSHRRSHQEVVWRGRGHR